jgi:hypothetical protein
MKTKSSITKTTNPTPLAVKVPKRIAKYITITAITRAAVSTSGRAKQIPIIIWLLLSGSVGLAADPGIIISNTASLTVGRMVHAIAHLPNGNVVCFGGHAPGFHALSTADVYDPTNASFSALTMNAPHDAGAIARLADGTYLLAGGFSDWGMSGYANAEVFDPATMTFTAVGSLNRSRADGMAATLASGKVLVAGGWWNWNDASSVAEVYDPQAKTFSVAGSLNTPRCVPVVFPCADGGAVVVGGITPFGGQLADASPEYFNPVTGQFSSMPASLAPSETGWTVSWQPSVVDDFKLPDGRYVLFASRSVGSNREYALFLFSPADKTFARVPLNPAFPISANYGRGCLTLDAAHNTAYVLGWDGTVSPLIYQLTSINLLTGAAANTSFAPFQQSYAPGAPAATFYQGKVFLTGGTTGDNFGAVPYTQMLSFGAVAPSLQIAMYAGYAGVTITGEVGKTYNVLGSQAASGSPWLTLTNFVLPSSPYLFFDSRSVTNRQFYRVELAVP